MKKFILLSLVLICAFLIDGEAFAQGCSQCKLIAEQGSDLDEDSFGSNINYGILYLMSIPYIIFMVIFRKRIYKFFKSRFTSK